MEAFEDWLARLAAPGPDPGGGAAAAVMLGLGSALTEMVAGYPPRTPGVALATVGAAASALRRRSLDLVATDSAASARLVAVWRAGDDPGELAEAAVAAARCGVEAIDVADIAVPLLEILAAHGDVRVLSDVGVAALAFIAAVRSSTTTLAGNLDVAAGAGAPSGEVEHLRVTALGADPLLARLEEVAGSMA